MSAAPVPSRYTNCPTGPSMRSRDPRLSPSAGAAAAAGPNSRSLKPPPATRRTCSSISSLSWGGLAMEKLRRRPSGSSTSRYCPARKRSGSTVGRRSSTCMTSGASGARPAMRAGRVLISTSPTPAMKRASTSRSDCARAWHSRMCPAACSSAVMPSGTPVGVADLSGAQPGAARAAVTGLAAVRQVEAGGEGGFQHRLARARRAGCGAAARCVRCVRPGSLNGSCKAATLD